MKTIQKSVILDPANEWMRSLISNIDSNGYARIKHETIHQLLMPNIYPLVVDHINQNKLDNRLCNLRAVSRSINALNSKHRINNKSGVKGVHFSPRRGKWGAYGGSRKVYEGFDFFEACCYRKSWELSHA